MKEMNDFAKISAQLDQWQNSTDHMNNEAIAESKWLVANCPAMTNDNKTISHQAHTDTNRAINNLTRASRICPQMYTNEYDSNLTSHQEAKHTNHSPKKQVHLDTVNFLVGCLHVAAYTHAV